jgi:hypothetical protein
MKFNSPQIQSVVSSIQKSPVTKGQGIIVSIDGDARIMQKAATIDGFAEYVVIDIQSRSPSFSEAGGYKELGLAAINCTAAVVAGLFTFSTAAASPFSGGSSLILTGTGYAATAATGLACANSAARVYNAAANPETNRKWDQSETYQTSMKVIDGVSLLGVGVAAVSGARVLGIMSKAGVSLRSATRGTVQRQARKRLARAIVEKNNPGISGSQYKSLVQSGTVAKRLTAKEVNKGLLKHLMDSIAAGLSFGASSADGLVYQVAVYVVAIEE